MRLILIAALAVTPVFGKPPAPGPGKKYNAECPAPKMCGDLLQHMQGCKMNTPGACARFALTYKKLIPESDCQRPEDVTPEKSFTVPAIWLCGTLHERALEFLSKLDTPRARALYRSGQLKNTLDGHLAETHGSR